MMSRDRRGMAVLVDALLFLTVLSVLSVFLMAPSGTVGLEENDYMVRSFHSVMLAGEVPGDDGSALSRLSLASYMVLIALDHSITPEELSRVGMGVNGTLAELKDMGQAAWWVLSCDGQEFVFGRPCNDTTASLFADRRDLSDDGSLFCMLIVVA